MHVIVSSVLVAVFAMGNLVAAAPQNNARERFKKQSCQSQACIDSVDSGCPLSNINFVLGGCDDPSQ
ncbi:hypothetical protein CH63R_02068 [Colletotrichum higginsianum IMI 349063]|uniref:Uncharacterized protein n=2 Tax=Colletotrichum higginsianum TaxID=80884 RepID=A0A1B7YN26_COLHI|nr:hypothetical protein CH63R_02068 [Colletotrichum higginsianum IMI 349063]OBR13342.1 hypothetical protein CH63R_02068 [Colletotrichum higginsianum IMI 349063]TID02080.1 hypothetical protein CH35J_003579 [Colletotrichum higginsianum]